MVAALLNAGADPNTRGYYGPTLLHDAVERGTSEVVAALLNAGVDPNTRGDFGQTLLHDAVERGSSEVVGALLNAGADPDAPNADGLTPREQAAAHDDPALAAAFEKPAGARSDSAPVTVAPANADVQIEQRIQAALAEAGFDPGPVDGSLGPRSRRAIRAWQRANGYPETGFMTSGQSRALLAQEGTAQVPPVAGRSQEAGPTCDAWGTEAFFRRASAADVAWCVETNDPSARDARGRTPLHAAATVSRDPAVVAALAEAGAQLDVRDEKGRTPLHLAAVLGELAIVTALVEAGASLDAGDATGRTPLQLAEKFGKAPDIADALREATEAAGASRIAPSTVSCGDWNTSEFFARADAAMVSRCLEEGANAGARDETGATPLHRAAGHSSDPEVVTALMDAGARVGARDETGATPLHAAAATSASAAVVEALLAEGADAATADEAGRTPRDYVEANPALRGTALLRRLAGTSCEDWNTARFFEHADTAIVSRCLGDGAEVGVQDDEEKTPLHFAASGSELPAVVEVLLDAGADAAARDKHGKVPWDYAKTNASLRGTEVYWRLNEERFR